MQAPPSQPPAACFARLPSALNISGAPSESTDVADARVTCASITSALAGTSVRTPHRLALRRFHDPAVRYGNMCNAIAWFVEHVRRSLCVAVTPCSPVRTVCETAPGTSTKRRVLLPWFTNRQRVSRSCIASRSSRSIAATAPNRWGTGVSVGGGVQGSFAQFRLHSES